MFFKSGYFFLLHASDLSLQRSEGLASIGTFWSNRLGCSGSAPSSRQEEALCFLKSGNFFSSVSSLWSTALAGDTLGSNGTSWGNRLGKLCLIVVIQRSKPYICFLNLGTFSHWCPMWDTASAGGTFWCSRLGGLRDRIRVDGHQVDVVCWHSERTNLPFSLSFFLIKIK